MSTLSPTYVVPFNSSLVSHLVATIQAGHGRQGRNLEMLAAYLFRTVPGFSVAMRQSAIAGEIDVLVANSEAPGKPLRWLGDYFLLECKDRNKTVNEKEFGHFLTKLNLTKTKQGAIISRKGLSGAPEYRYASRDQKLAYAEMGAIVLDLRIADLASLRHSGDLLALLQRKYEQLRFGTP
jgi:hypothetical protein